MSTFRSVSPGAILVLVVAGCQTYEPKPLDPAAHRGAWHSRLPSDEPVRVFAERLARSGDRSAGSFDPDDGLTLEEGELVALVFNPDLRLARLRAGVATATADHAGRWDDPEFAIDVLRVTENVSNPWVITPGLAITIPISGRLAAEKARASAAEQAELDRVAESEWGVRYEVRLAWLEWSAAKLRQEAYQTLLESVEALAASTAKLAEAGEMPRTEAGLFAIERSQRLHESRRLAGIVAESEQHLRALMGLSPEAPLMLTPTLELNGAAPAEPDALIERNPSLARLRQEYEVAEKALRREIRKQYPDLTLGPLYESDEGQSKVGFLGAIPIPILNANKQGIAEAKAERELARAAFETEYERLTGAIAAALARAVSLADERREITEQTAPLVDRQLVDARRLLELGESGGLVMLESLVRAHETKMHLIDVRREEASASAELAFLSGPPANTHPEEPPAVAADEVTP